MLTYSMHLIFYFLLPLVCIGILIVPGSLLAADPGSKQEPQGQAAVALYEGKLALDTRNLDRAIGQLTIARHNLPLLADYALYWRAQAYLAAGDADRAAEDIRTLRQMTQKGLLHRAVRQLELQWAEQEQDETLSDLYQRYLKDYPSDLDVKLSWAKHLQKKGSTSLATKKFREIFLTVSSAARIAEAELDPEDITADDWLKKARNLNSGWLFTEAEKAFHTAIAKNERLRSGALDGLSYALFRQKRYREAADTYAQTGNTYWHARSLLRANDLKSFETKIGLLLKSRESRNGALLLAYASKKRRAGDLEAAIKTYRRVASSYPSEREEALWLIGWAHYRNQDFAKAAETFEQLHVRHGGLKYLYWKNRSAARSAGTETSGLPESSMGTRDFYGYLSAVRQGSPLPPVALPASDQRVLNADRTDLLAALGFRLEAAQELKFLADKTSTSSTLVAIGEQLHRLGDHRNAVQTALRVPYSESIHDLHYPTAYWPEVEEAARINRLDPYLLLAIIREESRYDSRARSIAGALGLMQLMPRTAERTAKQIGIPFTGPESLSSPKTNVSLGAAYLKDLITEFGGIPYAIAAYNAGEEVVREWVRQGNYATVDEFIEDIPYYETQNYVKKVLLSYFQYLRAQNATTTGTIQRQLGRL